MGFNFKSDKYDTQSIYKRIVLRVDKYRSVSSSIIDDTPEALKDEAYSGASAVSWLKLKTPDDADKSIIFEGDFIIPLYIADPNHESTVEQILLRPELSPRTKVPCSQKAPDPESTLNEILKFTQGVQKKYGFSEKDLKLLVNRQWGWIGLIIPAGFLGTHGGGQALPAIYQNLGQRLFNRWKARVPRTGNLLISPSTAIFNDLNRAMLGVHQDEATHEDSLNALSAVWLDLRGNQKIFDLASLDVSSWRQVTHSNGDSVDQILYGRNNFPKTHRITKLAWEVISSAHQLLQRTQRFRELVTLQEPSMRHIFNYLRQVRTSLATGLHNMRDTFEPFNFYQCPAFSQMPTATIVFNDQTKPINVLKRDEINLLTNFKTGQLLDLHSSCQAIKEHFDCGNNCGIDSPLTLAFYPKINLQKKVIQTVVPDFDERDGILYHQKRRDKKLIEETMLCPVISTIALQREGKPTGDILVQQGGSTVATVVTSGELRPANARALLANLTRNHFQLEYNDFKVVKLIQKYLRLPSQGKEEVRSCAGWNIGAHGTLFFVHLSEKKFHPTGEVAYIQQLPGQKLCVVPPTARSYLPRPQAHPALAEIAGIADTAMMEWCIFLICLALSSTLLPFALLGGAGYFLWGNWADKLSRYIFSIMYGDSIDKYWREWPFEQVKPQGAASPEKSPKDKAKIYKRGPYNKQSDCFLDSYNHSFLSLSNAAGKPLEQLKRLGSFLALDKNRRERPLAPPSERFFLGSSRKKAKRCLNFITCLADSYQPQAQHSPAGHLVNLELGDMFFDLGPRFDGHPLMLAWLAHLEENQIDLNNISGAIADYLKQFRVDVLPPKKAKPKPVTKLRFGPLKRCHFTPKEEVAMRFGLASFAGSIAQQIGLLGYSLSEEAIRSACKNSFRRWLAQSQTIPRNVTNNAIIAEVRSTLRGHLGEIAMKNSEQKDVIGPYIRRLTKRRPSGTAPVNCPGYWHEFDQDKGIATCIITTQFLHALMPANLTLASFKTLLRRAGILLDKESRSFRIPCEKKVVRGYLFNLQYYPLWDSLYIPQCKKRFLSRIYMTQVVK